MKPDAIITVPTMYGVPIQMAVIRERGAGPLTKVKLSRLTAIGKNCADSSGPSKPVAKLVPKNDLIQNAGLFTSWCMSAKLDERALTRRDLVGLQVYVVHDRT